MTELLPQMPPLFVSTCVPERREPGVVAFNVRGGGKADHDFPGGWFVAIDQHGRTRLALKDDEPPQDIRLRKSGTILYTRRDGSIVEIDQTGTILNHWYTVGRWQGKQPPSGAIPIDVRFLHHAIADFRGEGLFVTSMEVRELPDWASSDSDPNAAKQTAQVVGDVICEVANDGTVRRQFHMLDLLDPYRICYGSLSPYWVQRGFPDTYDWCHANGLWYDESSDAVIVSLRTQDCIIKIDRQSGELVWILGHHENWRSPWKEKLLQPVGDLEWQFHQHDCSVSNTGSVLCFDNGNFRAAPFQPKMDVAESYSRAVEFEVDEKAGTVRQAWHYGSPMPDGFFSSYQSGVYRLPKTGNSFVTCGGLLTVDGERSDRVGSAFCTARLLEVTPNGEVVFDAVVDGSRLAEPISLSVFRAEHIPTEIWERR